MVCCINDFSKVIKYHLDIFTKCLIFFTIIILFICIIGKGSLPSGQKKLIHPLFKINHAYTTLELIECDMHYLLFWQWHRKQCNMHDLVPCQCNLLHLVPLQCYMHAWVQCIIWFPNCICIVSIIQYSDSVMFIILIPCMSCYP